MTPPVTTSAALSSAKPATAVDNPAYVATSQMRIGASDMLCSPQANPRCSPLNIAATSGSMASVGREFGHTLLVESANTLLRFRRLAEELQA